MNVRFHRHAFTFPSTEAPPWSAVVDRWYQLDPFAYGLADGAHRWRSQVTPPEMVFLASERASNETDSRFVQGGASSPAKFVHTLPNIRVSSLCLVMEWRGPVLCLQKDPQTVAFALSEAATFPGRSWVTGARHLAGDTYQAYLFELAPEGSAEGTFPALADDAALWRFLGDKEHTEWRRYE